MAFGITVHRRIDDEFYKSPPAVNSAEFDAWQIECERRWLYENSIANDSGFYHWWHVPAHTLGLPLLAAVYQHGLEVDGVRLHDLSVELEALSKYWATASVSVAAPFSLEQLQEQMDFVREAISIAQKCDGIIVIS